MWQWLMVVVGLVPAFGAGWAARGGDDAAYIQSRAEYLAQQMVAARAARWAPRPALPEPVEVIDAEVVYAHATRPDRPEVEA